MKIGEPVDSDVSDICIDYANDDLIDNCHECVYGPRVITVIEFSPIFGL